MAGQAWNNAIYSQLQTKEAVEASGLLIDNVRTCMCIWAWIPGSIPGLNSDWSKQSRKRLLAIIKTKLRVGECNQGPPYNGCCLVADCRFDSCKHQSQQTTLYRRTPGACIRRWILIDLASRHTQQVFHFQTSAFLKTAVQWEHNCNNCTTTVKL